MFSSAAWGFLGAALSADEKSRLGVWCYETSDEYRDTPRYEWEDAWLARALPGPPAHVLVAAAGGGREVLSLIFGGYQVTALEPSAGLARLCQSRVPRAVVVRGRYEDLAFGVAQMQARLGEEARPLIEAWTGARPFDAVILGLGSLSHLLDGGDRVGVVRALARAGIQPPSRASRWGRAFALPLRATRPLPPLDPNEMAFGGLGFAKMFTRPELRALGDAIGRETRFDEGAPDGMVLCEWIRG